jgi:spore coat polysaccharide biosynthesis predicted glycosyltransferase SpsG
LKRWLFITTASSAVGQGHLVRTGLIARAARSSGIAVEVVANVESVASVVERGVTWHVGEPTEGLLRPILRKRPHCEVVMIDAPETCLESLRWVGTELAEGARPLIVAFRVHGISQRLDPFEDVSLTPSIKPSSDEPRASPLGVRRHWQGRSLLFVRPTSFFVDGDAKAEPPTVLVTMGGGDPLDLTRTACAGLALVSSPVSTTVVTGQLYPRASDIEAEFGNRMRVIRQGVADFDGLLRRSTIAVINGGLTRYECVAAETPFVAVSMNDHQARLTTAVTRCGFGIHAGVHDQVTPVKLSEIIDALVANPTRLARMRNAAIGMVNPANIDIFVRRIQRTAADARANSHRPLEG